MAASSNEMNAYIPIVYHGFGSSGASPSRSSDKEYADAIAKWPDIHVKE